MSRQQRLTFLSAVAGLAFAALLFTPLFVPHMSPVTKGVLVGIAGVACLLGVAFGVREARSMERRRKAKEEIWIKH